MQAIVAPLLRLCREVRSRSPLSVSRPPAFFRAESASTRRLQTYGGGRRGRLRDSIAALIAEFVDVERRFAGAPPV